MQQCPPSRVPRQHLRHLLPAAWMGSCLQMTCCKVWREPFQAQHPKMPVIWGGLQEWPL